MHQRITNEKTKYFNRIKINYDICIENTMYVWTFVGVDKSTPRGKCIVLNAYVEKEKKVSNKHSNVHLKKPEKN